MKTDTNSSNSTSTKQSETFSEGLNVAKKWFNETNIRMTDAYNRQLSQSFEFFNHLINPTSTLANTSWLSGGNATELYAKNSEIFLRNLEKNAEMYKQMVNSMFTAFDGFNKDSDTSKGTMKAILEAFEKQIEKMVEYNKQLFTTIGKEYAASQSDIDSINQKFEQKLKNDFEVSRDAVRKFIDTHSNKTDFSLEAGTKLAQEINSQIQNVVENNKTFWSGLLKTPEVKKTEEKKVEEKKLLKQPVKILELANKK